MLALGNNRAVTQHYWQAAQNWLAGQPLYNGAGHGFIYLPQSAVLFVPFTLLPSLLREIVWRLLTVGVFAWGLERLIATRGHSSTRPLFSTATLVTLPIASGCARNGQATLLIGGLMMAAVALATRKRWWRSAACLVLATALKPITLPLLLLAAALYRPLIGRLLLGCAVAAILPSLTQSPSYVHAQYVGCQEMFAAAAEWANARYFAQVFSLFKIVGYPLAASATVWVQALFGSLLLAVCWRYRPRNDNSPWGIQFYALATAYLLLFNPRTENSTYALLAPPLGICFAQAWLVDRRPGRAVFFGLLAAGILGNYEIGRWLTGADRAVWLSPLVAILFASDVLVHMIAEEVPQPANGFATSGAAQTLEARRPAA